MANFTIQKEVKNDVCIIRTNGYLDEHGGAELCDAVENALPDGHQKFIIDLSQSPVINSQGISQIIELAEIIVDETNGVLAFSGLSELANGVFRMVGLLQMGESYPSEAEALAALAE